MISRSTLTPRLVEARYPGRKQPAPVFPVRSSRQRAYLFSDVEAGRSDLKVTDGEVRETTGAAKAESGVDRCVRLPWRQQLPASRRARLFRALADLETMCEVVMAAGGLLAVGWFVTHDLGTVWRWAGGVA